MAMHDVTAIGVFPEPLEDGMGELLVRVCLHYLWLEVGMLQALPLQIGLLIYSLGILAE
jgi:uncharacterized membrane protein